MNDYSFQTLLAKKAKFINGEDISPSKLTGMSAQIETAFGIVQDFLGNGTDYQVNPSSLDSRKLLSNISSAIGRGDKIYKPVNRFFSLEQVNTVYLSGNASVDFNSSTEILTIDAGATATITMNVTSNDKIGIFYQSDCTDSILIAGDSIDAAEDYTWKFTSLSDTGTVSIVAGDQPLYIKSLVISTYPFNGIDSFNRSDLDICNIAYSIPLNNNVYFKLATPCKYASISSLGRAGLDEDQICLSLTCDYCIGNTYYYGSTGVTGGQVTCIGAVNVSGGISYSPDITTKKTIQSPLLTINMPYSAKYMPFKFYDGVSAGSMLPKNMLALYDITNNTSPMLKNIDFYSADSNRGDIVFIENTSGIVDNDENKQFLLIGGTYGISDLMWDILTITKGF